MKKRKAVKSELVVSILVIIAFFCNPNRNIIAKSWDESTNDNALIKTEINVNSIGSFIYPQRGTNWIIPDLGMEFIPVTCANSSCVVLFSKYETRVKDFEAFMKDKNYKCTNDMITLGINQNKNPKQGDSWKHPGFPQQPDHPVVGINWLDAVRFCQWLTARERKAGRLLENQLYRLPSDEEWSRAAGLPKEIGETPRRRYANTGYNLYEGDIYRYSLMMREICPWGIYGHTNIPRGVANYAGCESGLAELDYFTFGSYEDGYPRTAPVGSFKANQYGLYDMGGNVWEWCSDYENGGSNGMGVLRGASWAAGPEEIYSSFRRFVDPQLRENDIGFRVVLFVGEVTGWNQGHSSRAVKSP